MKTSLDYWIEIDRQKERALKRIEKEKERERKLKKPKGGNKWQEHERGRPKLVKQY
jgi:hypothetical protein